MFRNVGKYLVDLEGIGGWFHDLCSEIHILKCLIYVSECSLCFKTSNLGLKIRHDKTCSGMLDSGTIVHRLDRG